MARVSLRRNLIRSHESQNARQIASGTG